MPRTTWLQRAPNATGRRCRGAARWPPRRVSAAAHAAMGSLDVEAARRDTPGCSGVAHFNNAGSSLPSAPVVEAGKEWLDLEAEIGGYEAVARRPEVLRKPYTSIAELVNCSPDEVAVVTSATIAWQQVFFGIPFQPGDRILTSQAEYGSNFINFLQVAQRFGAKIEVIPETPDGDIDSKALAAMLVGPTPPRLVAITHVPTSSGRVYDAAAVGAATRAAGVPYLLDACQSVGQMPIDVQRIGCDFLTATGRKYLRAPRGCGFLFASKAAMQLFPPAMLDVWGAEWESASSFSMAPTARRYESYEMSFAAKAGLGVAVQYALDLSLESIWERVQALADALRAGLCGVPGVEVADKGRTLCGIVSFTKEEVAAEAVQKALAESGINVSVSQRRSTVLDFDERSLQAVVRASVHYYNTEEEVSALVAAVANVR